MQVQPAHSGNDPKNSSDRCLIGPVSIEPKSWRIIQKEINTLQEFGGNFKYNKEKKVLQIIPSSIVRGEHDNVTIPHSRYEFHTHPSKCKKSICALGIPSVADIHIHLEDVNSDNFANFVFERDGMWIMVPSRQLRGPTHRKMLKGAQQHANKMINLLRNISKENYARKYEQFRETWLQNAQSKGIYMKFIPWQDSETSPNFIVPVPCA